MWKMRGVENAECGKCGVWKMRRKFQFPILNAEKKKKKKNAMNHCILRCTGLGW